MTSSERVGGSMEATTAGQFYLIKERWPAIPDGTCLQALIFE